MHAETIPDPTRAPELPVGFVEPMPGFEEERAFTLTPIDAGGYLYSLRSVRSPQLRFVITPVDAFFADYGAALADSLAAPLVEALGTASADLYLVLTVGADLADTTANMRAPLALDPATGRAVQLVLDDGALDLRRPLVAA